MQCEATATLCMQSFMHVQQNYCVSARLPSSVNMCTAVQWHIRSVKPEFEEKFSDRLQREKAEAEARQPPQLPGSRLSITFKPPDGSRRE